MKRKKQNNNNNNNNSKRKKLVVDSFSLSRDSFTHLEDLSNELFCEIFDFLDLCDVYQAFSNLNIRFENLFNDSTLPIRVRLSFTSKSIFQRYYKRIIISNQHRITSLHLLNSLIIDRIFSRNSIVLKFIRLENLNLCDIEPNYLEKLLIHLITLPCLSSLVIDCTNDVYNKNIIYQQIFRLPALKYCKLILEGNAEFNPLPIATTEFSSIEYLIIIGTFYIDELNAFFIIYSSNSSFVDP